MAMTIEKLETCKSNLSLPNSKSMDGYKEWSDYVMHWNNRIKKGWVVIEGQLINPSSKIKRFKKKRMSDPAYAARVQLNADI